MKTLPSETIKMTASKCINVTFHTFLNEPEVESYEEFLHAIREKFGDTPRKLVHIDGLFGVEIKEEQEFQQEIAPAPLPKVKNTKSQKYRWE